MLPKIEYPILDILVPSINKQYKFRPFLVKEEKILLMARESENTNDILQSIKQIITNCSLDDSLNVDAITVFDIELLFIKLRAFSINNIVKVSYTDNEDKKLYSFDVDLNKVELTSELPDKTIKITEKAGIIMKYPSASLYSDQDFLKLEKDHLFELIVKCIDKIYYEDTIYESKDYKKEELVSWLDELNLKVFENIQAFLLNVPQLKYELNYTNENGNKRSITLSSLNDFFTWR